MSKTVMPDTFINTRVYELDINMFAVLWIY